MMVSSPPFESPLIVEVDDDRPKVCVNGARWVSFNSKNFQIELASIPDSHVGGEGGGGRERDPEVDRQGDQLNILLVSFQDMVAVLRKTRGE